MLKRKSSRPAAWHLPWRRARRMCSHPMSVPKCRGRCPSCCSCKWPSEKNNTCLSCFTCFAWEEPTWPSECQIRGKTMMGSLSGNPLLAIEYHLVCFLSPPTSYSDFTDLSVQSMETADCVCIIHTASYGTWGHCRQTWWDPKSLKGFKRGKGYQSNRYLMPTIKIIKWSSP